MVLEALQRRNYSEGTTRRYLRFVERFAQHFGRSPDKLAPLPYPRSRSRLPIILSQEEITRLFNASSTLFACTLLMVFYGTGMRRS